VRQVRRTLGGTWRHWPGLLCSLKTTSFWGREIDRVEEVQSKGTEDKVAGRQLPIDVRPFFKKDCQRLKEKETAIKTRLLEAAPLKPLNYCYL